MKTKTIRKKEYDIYASANRYSTEEAGLAAITKCIEQFWYRKDITLIKKDGEPEWNIKLGNEIHERAIVINQGKNYHFAFPAHRV